MIDASATAARRVAPADPEGGRSARKRQAIIEAASALFLQAGYQGTSMDDIAALAAVSKQTVYKNFADKERLFHEIVLGTLDRAGEPFRVEIQALDNTADLTADLRRLAHHYLATVMQPQVLQLRRMIIGEANRLPELARTYYEQAQERTLQLLAACFARLAARGMLRREDPLLAASQFAFLVVGRALDKSLFYGDNPCPPAQLKAQAEAAVRVFLAAYRPDHL
jgi:TetR/AcrR family transcriptional regulator, mexJK operon transcriptional repressor